MSKILTVLYDKKEKIRIDKYLVSLKNDALLSRSYIDKLITKGFIKVNSEVCKKNYKLSFGDTIEVDIPPKKEQSILPLDLDLDIVYEDEYLIIVNKPWGLTVHPAPGHYDDTLVNALIHHYKNNLSSINSDLRPGIVHRLDKDTSGLIIIAKDDKTHLLLSEMFQKKLIKKTYSAICVNVPPKNRGTIETYLNRDKRDRKKYAVSNTGKKAVTHYKVIKSFEYFSFLELDLETGRTHQIRIHLSYINCPILGDKIYSGTKQILSQLPDKFHKKVKGLLKNHLHRQALHSTALEFTHPITQKNIVVKSDLPDDMKYTLNWIETNFPIL